MSEKKPVIDADRIAATEESLESCSLEELLELAQELNLQDPAPDFESLVRQLTPIVAFSEFLQELKEGLEEGDYLLAVKEEGDPEEVFGWYLDLDETLQVLYLAPLGDSDQDSRQVLLSESTRVRICSSPKEEADQILSRTSDGMPDLNLEDLDLDVRLKVKELEEELQQHRQRLEDLTARVSGMSLDLDASSPREQGMCEGYDLAVGSVLHLIKALLRWKMKPITHQWAVVNGRTEAHQLCGWEVGTGWYTEDGLVLPLCKPL